MIEHIALPVSYKDKLIQKVHKMSNYYYKVEEFVTTFKKDINKSEPFSHEQIFKLSPLIAAKNEAMAYYSSRIPKLENGTYHLPFHSSKDFIFGQHAAYSLTLSLVEIDPSGEEFEYILLGGDPDEMKEADGIENSILNF